MKPTFKDGYRFGKDTLDVKIGKTKIKTNKPVCLGLLLFDLRKLLMREFYYNYI